MSWSGSSTTCRRIQNPVQSNQFLEHTIQRRVRGGRLELPASSRTRTNAVALFEAADQEQVDVFQPAFVNVKRERASTGTDREQLGVWDVEFPAVREMDAKRTKWSSLVQSS